MTDQNRTKTLCEIFYQDSNTAISRQGRNQNCGFVSITENLKVCDWR